jgi:hypothetical protein
MTVDSLIEDIAGEMHSASYPASQIKRRRATREEMEERAAFLIRYAEQHGPVTVRGLYYQAEVHGVPGIDKTENGYAKVQEQVLKLRRSGRLAYQHIADATRWMRKPRSFDDMEEALRSTAALYRKNLWRDNRDYIEVWLEKDAIAGVIYDITSVYDVPLMVARGFSSETFCFEAVEARGDDDRPYHVCYLGDFDRSGRDAAQALREKLERFAEPKGIPIIFTELAVTVEQIVALGLPTRPPKRNSPADRKWEFEFACELDAIPPDRLRQMVEDAIQVHLPYTEFHVLKEAEKSERDLLRAWAEARAS